jgi:uncharacterized protein YjiS (DUF1127 family)
MMRAQLVSTPNGGLFSLAIRGGRIIVAAWYRHWDNRARRATVQILHSLDDRTLRDIGISRGEITSVVFGECSGHGHRRCYDDAWRWRAGC